LVMFCYCFLLLGEPACSHNSNSSVALSEPICSTQSAVTHSSSVVF